MNIDKSKVVTRIIMLLIYIYMMFAYPLERLSLLLNASTYNSVYWAWMPWWAMLLFVFDIIAAILALIMFSMAFKITLKELIKCFRA